MDWLMVREPFSAWSHAMWLLLSLPATVLLWRLGRGDRLKQFGLLVFGLSLSCCFAGSVLYHSVRLPQPQLEWFEMLDFIGVYLLIAGTVTPVALVVLRGRWRWGILATVWLMGASGIGLRLAGVPLSRFVSTGIYLGMGWAVILSYLSWWRPSAIVRSGLACLAACCTVWGRYSTTCTGRPCGRVSFQPTNCGISL